MSLMKIFCLYISLCALLLVFFCGPPSVSLTTRKPEEAHTEPGRQATFGRTDRQTQIHDYSEGVPIEVSALVSQRDNSEMWAKSAQSRLETSTQTGDRWTAFVISDHMSSQDSLPACVSVCSFSAFLLSDPFEADQQKAKRSTCRNVGRQQYDSFIRVSYKACSRLDQYVSCA